MATQDYLNDPAFLKATPEDQSAYLMDTDPAFRAASLEDRQGYLQSLRREEAPPTKEVGPVTRGIAGLFHRAGEKLQELLPLPWETRTPEQRQAGMVEATKLAVPQTPAEAGILAGTLATGGLAGPLVKGATWGARAARAGIRGAGAAGGGATGGAVEGEPLAGLESGATAAAFGEFALPGLLMGIRHVPGVAALIERAYGKNVTRIANELVPALEAKKTIDFADVAKAALESQTGKTRLGAMIEQTENRIAGEFGGKKLTITMPAEMGKLTTRREVVTSGMPGGGTLTEAVELTKLPSGEIVRGTKKVTEAVGGIREYEKTVEDVRKQIQREGRPRAVTFTEALGEMRRQYKIGFTAEKAGRGETADLARAKAKIIREQIVDGLETGKKGLGKAFDEAQVQYDRGLELATTIADSLTLRPSGARISEAGLQQSIFDRWNKLTQAFKREPGALQEFEAQATRGAGRGAKARDVGLPFGLGVRRYPGQPPLAPETVRMLGTAGAAKATTGE